MDLTGNMFSGNIPANTAVSTTFADGLLTGLEESAAMRRLSFATNLLDGTIPAGLWRVRLQACFSAYRLYCLVLALAPPRSLSHGTTTWHHMAVHGTTKWHYHMPSLQSKPGVGNAFMHAMYCGQQSRIFCIVRFG